MILELSRNGQSFVDPHQSSRRGTTATVVIGVAITVLGAFAVIAFYLSPQSYAQKGFDLSHYAFVLLGGGVLVTTISSIILHRVRKEERLVFSNCMAIEAYWGRGITYVKKHDKEKCNLGVSYADPVKGFGMVLDRDKDNPERDRLICATFDELIQNYQAVTSAHSIQEARNTISEQLLPFNDQKKYQLIFGAAVSFCQLVLIGDTTHLLLFQWADTRVLIQKRDGSFDWLDGLYSQKIDPTGFGHKYKMESYPIEKGTTIIGFSGVIGEYMTKEMFIKIYNQQSEKPLLDRLVDTIQKDEIAINGKKLKPCQEKNGDVSLFLLKV